MRYLYLGKDNELIDHCSIILSIKPTFCSLVDKRCDNNTVPQASSTLVAYFAKLKISFVFWPLKSLKQRFKKNKTRISQNSVHLFGRVKRRIWKTKASSLQFAKANVLYDEQPPKNNRALVVWLPLIN